jgi:hypothetical protein
MSLALSHYSWACRRQGTMNINDQDTGAQAAYTYSVERERQAWQTLQSFPPGSIGRARAWEDWSRAITSTNHAWRQLSAGRAARPHASA